MRASASGLGPRDETVPVAFEGRALTARRGETLAATLAAHGETVLRQTRGGAERGLFCGMGVCQDCLVTVDGRPNTNACMTVVDRPMTVARQVFPPALAPGPDHGPHAPPPADPDVLVVGAGAGGLSAAALAAEAGASVLVVDERPKPGGQYFKQPAPGIRLPPGADDAQFAGGRALLVRALAAGVHVLRGTAVAVEDQGGVLVASAEGPLWPVRARRIVVAAGAYERPHPVPGWTLPGVMTTGALQTLLRTDRVLAGRRILVAGNGPLNLQVALELARAGAELVGVAEAAPAPGPGRLGAIVGMAVSSPALLARGAATVARLRYLGVPIHWSTVVTRIGSGPEGLGATLRTGTGATASVAADVVGLGYGFLPAAELLRLFGCRQDFDTGRGQLVTHRDEAMRTSVPGVFAVGDCCGLGGAPAAQAEGLVAGAAAAQELGLAVPARLRDEARRARGALGRARHFQKALWSLFAAPRPGLSLASSDTPLCRCEEVTLGAVENAIAAGAADMGSLKRATRLGMGRCQGRYCGPLAFALLHERGLATADPMSFFAPRPPLRPVTLGAVSAPRAWAEGIPAASLAATAPGPGAI